MRFRKGDNVEVINKKEVPFSWCPAWIVSGNGHTYHVQFYGNRGEASGQIETVSSKVVRPSPPPVQGVRNWIVGEIVEVFFEYTWKVATILKVLEPDVKSRKVPNREGNKCVVRLHGFSREVIVDGSNIRVRQTWHDGKWILIVKSAQGADAVSSLLSSPKFYHKTSFRIPECVGRAEQQPRINGWNIKGEAACWEARMTSSRKRTSPYGSFVVGVRNGHIKKSRAIEKDSRKQRVVAAPVLGKVKNAICHPRDEKIDVLGNSRVGNSENSSDSNSCSVGSCSVADPSLNSFYIPFIPLLPNDAISSDAESCNGSGSLPREDVEISIRWLELCAYRRTLEALYASGPLSWEQEALLTNLRIMLHISNDEHLTELKHLISARTATNNR